jgi:hypothetical protein
MTEEYLHYVWKTRQFNQNHLFTSDGVPVEVLRPGEHNTNAGPDFFNARIRLGGMIWAGNVEIHLRTSDWDRHGHRSDQAYDNVILHVVYDDDSIVHAPALFSLPTIILRSRLDGSLYEQYIHFRNSKRLIACEHRLPHVPPLITANWLGRLLAERFEEKTNLLRAELQETQADWDEVFYRRLARHFGMLVNAEPFGWLTRALPYKLLARHRMSLLQLEALLFGQAGLLPELPEDDYSKLLSREYRVLAVKYTLTPMSGHLWKFSRLRPSNFATIRIAQLAALLFEREHLFDSFCAVRAPEEIFALLDVKASSYWETHYRFGHETERSIKKLGRQAALSIVINTVIPMLFLRGHERGEDWRLEQARSLLEGLPAEQNTLVAAWAERGLVARDAGEGQALIHLKKNYCDKKRCLQCGIGQHVLEKS